VALLLAATVSPVIILGWLGWRLLREDQALENRRVQARLENAAEGIAAALDRSLSDLEQHLSALAAATSVQARSGGSKLAGDVGDDTLVVLVDQAGVEAYPGGRLLYYPWLPAPSEPSEKVFAVGEAMELQRNDPAGASAVYRQLARSTDAGTRAGALLRLARSLRKSGQPEEAFATYGAMTALSGLTIRGIPADLLARQARCSLLEEMDRVPEMSREARALYSDLQNGRWKLVRATFKFHSDEARKRFQFPTESKADQTREQARLALAEAVEPLWNEWQKLRMGEGDPSGRRGLRAGSDFVSLFWRSQTDRMIALVAGQGFAANRALGWVQPLALRQGVKAMLTDAEGRAIASTAQGTWSRRVILNPAETHLPWTLFVASLDPVADVAEIAGRRRILLAAFAVMIAVVLVGSYFLARAVTREREAARLKSDFVAAVSHEFRTPLGIIQSSAELLREFYHKMVPVERDEQLESIARNTRRMAGMMEEILILSRLDAGKLDFQPAVLDLSAFCRRLVDEVHSATSNRCPIELSLAAVLPPAHADERLLAYILTNLLSNAVCLVRDEGIGISAEDQQMLFTAFHRGTNVGSRAGTGLGLLLVKRCVELHHGDVRIQSQIGKGTTVTVRLPVFTDHL
jgi:signal transduction histidine kinase